MTTKRRAGRPTKSEAAEIAKEKAEAAKFAAKGRPVLTAEELEDLRQRANEDALLWRVFLCIDNMTGRGVSIEKAVYATGLIFTGAVRATTEGGNNG